MGRTWNQEERKEDILGSVSGKVKANVLILYICVAFRSFLSTFHTHYLVLVGQDVKSARPDGEVENW